MTKKELTLKQFHNSDVYDVYDEKKKHIGAFMFNFKTELWSFRRQHDNEIFYE